MLFLSGRYTTGVLGLTAHMLNLEDFPGEVNNHQVNVTAVSSGLRDFLPKFGVHVHADNAALELCN